jgi:CRISPR system Cascade subunit CasE
MFQDGIFTHLPTSTADLSLLLTKSQARLSRDPVVRRQSEALWKGGRGSQVSFESPPEDEWPRESSCGLHSAVEYRGVLTVTDPARFYGTFTRGIGSAKAFGFGLLVIVPLQ